MTPTEALIEMMRESRSERTPSTASLKRTVRACKTLGIEGRELWRVLAYLDIASGETGEPYSKHVPRLWP